MGLKHTTAKSFKYAFEGLLLSIKREPNMKIHLAIASFAVFLALFLKLSTIEWVILTITIFLVLILELINTVLEALVNIVSPDFQNEAKVAKDVSAAAVLLGAIASVIIGLFLFLPKIVLFLA